MPYRVEASMNIPGTFEVFDASGRYAGTFTEFKTAEATVDMLKEREPEAGWDWTVVR
ncbi:hypothetical protein [Streptomyces bluensis]|uniref:SPOR domain-containing protein n=1 Tax=Streptomyces bluensis TaxID=33897 RepID=A0ABW6UWM3_9ACTN